MCAAAIASGRNTRRPFTSENLADRRTCCGAEAALKVPILRALGCVQQSGAGFAVAIQGSVPACADRPQMGVAKTGEIFQPIAKAAVEGGMSHKYKGHLP